MKIVKDPRIETVLNRISDKDHADIFSTVKLFRDYEFRLPAKYLKKLTDIIWELRAKRYRVLFGMRKDKAILLHIFYKKTQKTPRKDLDLAVKRYKQYI